MPLALPRYTLRDLESFPDDGCRYELLDGVLLVTPAPAPLHQLVALRISTTLATYLGPRGPGRVFSPGSVELEPNLHLEPDVLVVPAGALQPGLREETRWTDIRRWWLAVEVSGKGSTPYDRDSKGPAYLALGVPEVWRVDLRDRCVFVSRTGTTEVRHDDHVTWLAPGMSEPMVLPVADLFLP
ncbi:MAG TPA: Uma2 family endonuclease [Gemmatimonadales bacterium]|nr:Uma2 family endonuclease [Gemmatimonadales bacterium]